MRENHPLWGSESLHVRLPPTPLSSQDRPSLLDAPGLLSAARFYTLLI